MTAPEQDAAQPRWRRVTAAAVAVVVVLGIGVWWWQDHRKGVTFTGLFTASVGIYPGSDVRILGVRVGSVDSVTPDGAVVRIAMHLDRGVNATAGTSAVIISPNLVSDRYVQLTGVYSHGPKLTSGSVIPHSRTRTPVELDQLYGSLLKLTTALGPKGANAHGALSNLLNTGAANLGGTGTEINQTITRLSKASSTLDGSKRNVFGTLRNLASFTGMLKTNNSGLVAVNQELSSVTGTLAADRQTFGEAMHDLAGALSLVQHFVHDNRAALSTNVAKLSRVAHTLAGQRASLTKALKGAPLLAQNFVNAYDPKRNLLRGRINPNDLTLWNRQTAASGSTNSAIPLTGSDAPPALLPSSDVTTVSGG